MASKDYTAHAAEYGCDFTVHLPAGRKPRLLQLTDMQIIDASQRRYPERLCAAELRSWPPENVDVECLDHIRSLVAQTRPDLIFITGDIVYGSFDDSGRTFTRFVEFMEGLGIPWAPVFGNHDNESQKGVDWQCAGFAAAEHCLFARGTVTGNGNYTVGIMVGGTLCRVLYLLDSGGCLRRGGLEPDQVAWLKEQGEQVGRAGNVPGFAAFHIPTEEFLQAARAAGYATEEETRNYVIGVDVPARNGDFGCHRERCVPGVAEGLREALRAARVDGVFAGHTHAINTSVLYDGVRYTYGLKTGQYDYHIPGHLGGTLITLSPDAAPGAVPDNTESAPFTVGHVPALVLYGPFPV